MSADDLAAGESRDETPAPQHDGGCRCCHSESCRRSCACRCCDDRCCDDRCGDDRCCDDRNWEPEPDSEPTALGRALERLLGVTAALCAVALMIGGTIALLRWWLSA